MGTIKDFETAHDKDDTDFEANSKHHTIGKSAVQAAAGNHNHDADYSDISHNHDSAYSPVGHNHDTLYEPLHHFHVLGETEVATSNVANTTPTAYTLRLTLGPIAVIAGKWYEMKACFTTQSDTAAALSRYRLMWDTVSGGVAGTVLQDFIIDHRAAARSTSHYISAPWQADANANRYFKLLIQGGTVGAVTTDRGDIGPTRLWVSGPN